MTRPEEIAKTIFELMKEAKETYDENFINIDLLEDETQDLLHEIELGTANAVRRVRLFNELKKVRQKRRQAKYDNEMLIELVKVIKGDVYQNFKHALKEVKKIRAIQNGRKYFPKVREDLTVNDVTEKKHEVSVLKHLKETLESKNVG